MVVCLPTSFIVMFIRAFMLNSNNYLITTLLNSLFWNSTAYFNHKSSSQVLYQYLCCLPAGWNF